MKTIEELKKFYDSTLINDLKILEEKRQKSTDGVGKAGYSMYMQTYVFFAIMGIIIVLFSSLLRYIIKDITIQSNIIKISSTIFSVVFIIGFLLIIRKIRTPMSKYLSGISFFWKKMPAYDEFKTNVIRKLIKFIDKNLNYSQDGYISQDDYITSKLFKRHPDRYTGDDLIFGRIDKTILMFSEIDSAYNSGGSTEFYTIFKGLFFVADFNKKFKGETFVLPDFDKKNFKGTGELIKLEDIEFEKYFTVYGSDQIESRYILSTSLMKRIVDYKEEKDKNIYISFVNNKIYVAISCNKDLFEPKTFESLLVFNLIKEYYEDLCLAVDIIEDLNLNTRIWG